MEPTTTAIGTWSGGRFMHFGEPLGDDRLIALLSPGEGIDTVITADVYGSGDADRLLGRALAGRDRDDYCLVGAVGHDFYTGERDGPRGFPRFTDARLRGPGDYASYLRTAAECSLERCGVDHFDLLLLHNPDRTGYRSDAVWDGMAALRDAGLTRLLGVAPGPANGFTLDLLDCFERHGAVIDWAMIILSPMEPWPGELVLDAAAAASVDVITRVVDYGGVFHDDVRPGHVFAEYDHRRFRPAGWVEDGCARLDRMRPYAGRHGLTMLQLACAWNLARPAVRCVAPTLIQEAGGDARPIEDKRAELASLPRAAGITAGAPTLVGAPEPSSSHQGRPAVETLTGEEVDAIRAIGDNTGCMALKGASVEHEGPERPDRWGLDAELGASAERWGIDPRRDLAAGDAQDGGRT
jgi:aryl-alcohol dehydrogenase-like predicted oxidoreductase